LAPQTRPCGQEWAPRRPAPHEPLFHGTRSCRLPPMSASHSETPAVDVQEHGAPRDGKPQVLDRRLFMQLLVYQCPASVRPVAARNALEDALRKSELASVVYEDVNDPRSLGVLSLSEAPASFVDRLRPALLDERLDGLSLRHDQTMLGRTYSSGFEDNLEYWLLERP